MPALVAPGHAASTGSAGTCGIDEVLAASIARSLERSPSGWLDRFERSHHLVELGMD